MNKVLDETLEKIIYEETGTVLEAIVNAFRKIKPDKTAQSQISVNDVFKKAMRAKLYSIRFLFTKRKKYPPTQNKARISLSPQSKSQIISDELGKIISSQSAFDAATFLGDLMGMYIRICPRELFRLWAESTNGLINSSAFSITETMASHVAMSIDY